MCQICSINAEVTIVDVVVVVEIQPRISISMQKHLHVFGKYSCTLILIEILKEVRMKFDAIGMQFFLINSSRKRKQAS